MHSNRREINCCWSPCIYRRTVVK